MTTSESEVKLSDDIDANKLLVEIVQGLLMAHARLDHLENYLTNTIYSCRAEQLTEAKKHQTALEAHLVTLGGKSTALDTFAQSEAAKQSENWKNLNLYLKSWQVTQEKTFATATKDVQLDIAKVIAKLTASQSDLSITINHQAAANRRLLVWLIWLVAFSVSALGAIIYRLFTH